MLVQKQVELHQYVRQAQRPFQFFPCVFTGSGMGKTRFGYEMPSKLKECKLTQKFEIMMTFTLLLTVVTTKNFYKSELVEVLQNRMDAVFINFNGCHGSDDTDQIQEDDINAGALNSIQLRLYARAILGISAINLKSLLLPGERKLFDDDTFKYLSQHFHKKHNVADDQTVCIFLHIDEVQLAFEQAQTEKRFVTDMIEAIGDFRTGAIRQKLFIIPLLTGTNRGNLNFTLDGFNLRYLKLEPLSIRSGIKLFKGQLSPYKIKNSLHKVSTLMYSLGVIPRALEHSVRALPRLEKSQKMDWQLVSGLITQAIETSYSNKLAGILDSISSSSIWKLVDGIFNESSWGWTKEEQERLAQSGLVYFHSNTSEQIFWPPFFYSLFFTSLQHNFNFKSNRDYKYTCDLFQRLFPFPFPSEKPWEHFEEMAIGSIVLRMRIAHHLGKDYIPLDQLLPGANIPIEWSEVRVKVRLLKLVKEQRKWLDGSALLDGGGSIEALKISDNDNNLSVSDYFTEIPANIDFFSCEYAALLAKNTSIFDARVVLEIHSSRLSPFPKFLLLAIQMKFFGDSKTKFSWTKLNNQIQKEIDMIKQHYAEKNSIFIPAFIINRNTTREKPKNIISVDRTTLPKLLPGSIPTIRHQKRRGQTHSLSKTIQDP